MGREQRTESTIDRTASTVQPQRFIFVGAPGVGKLRIAEAVAERFGDDEKLALMDDYFLYNTRYALGSVADYRIELHLALVRYMRETDVSTLYPHSLIDNLAYITYAVSRYQLGTVDIGTVQRAMLTMTIIGTMITDSFKYDHIFFIRGDFDPNEDYDQYQLQTILQMILDDYQMNYSIIEAGPDAADQIGDILEGYLA